MENSALASASMLLVSDQQQSSLGLALHILRIVLLRCNTVIVHMDTIQACKFTTFQGGNYIVTLIHCCFTCRTPSAGTISRFCGYDSSSFMSLPCPAKHDPTLPLVVALKLDSGFEQAGVTWSVQAGTSTTLVEGQNAKGLRKTTLTGVAAHKHCANALQCWSQGSLVHPAQLYGCVYC